MNSNPSSFASQVIVFAVSWLPHHVTVLWLKLGNFPYNSGTFVLRVVAHCLSYANSCLNPVIYGCVSASFRRHLGRIVLPPNYRSVQANMGRLSVRFSTTISWISRSVSRGPVEENSSPQPRSKISTRSRSGRRLDRLAICVSPGLRRIDGSTTEKIQMPHESMAFNVSSV